MSEVFTSFALRSRTGQLLNQTSTWKHADMHTPIPVDVVDSWVDYAALAIGFAGTLATLIAVLLSYLTARQARADLKIETGRREAAEARTVAAQLEVAEAQARVSRELADEQAQRERDRFNREHSTTPAERALRQADRISVHGRITKLASDLLGSVEGAVSNASDAPIFDVSLTFDRQFGVPIGTPAGRGDGTQESPHASSFYDRVEPSQVLTFSWYEVHMWGQEIRDKEDVPTGPKSENAPVVLTFTDEFGDEWRLTPGPTLTLLNPKRITG